MRAYEVNMGGLKPSLILLHYVLNVAVLALICTVLPVIHAQHYSQPDPN